MHIWFAFLNGHINQLLQLQQIHTCFVDVSVCYYKAI